MKVSNRKIIRKLSIRSLKAGKSRNVIAALAIALTTLMFTALFTIVISISNSIQEADFKRAGAYNHGTFKNLTEEQMNTLKQDDLIKEYGKRMLIGSPDLPPFDKDYVEVAYSDKTDMKFSYSLPIEGRLPKEGTNEATADTHVLALLGVKQKVGQPFTLTINENGKEKEEKFTLSGWWKPNEETQAYFVNIPRSRAEEIVAGMGSAKKDFGIGKWSLNVMLANSRNIKRDLNQVLKSHGYQSKNRSNKKFIDIGVNWGYVGAQISNNGDSGMVLAGVALVLIIMLTGYLIIYNIFKISVINDIHFYGLLKTIGTTGRQLKRIIRLQALVLSVFGIPFGLLAGYGLGVKLTPIITASAVNAEVNKFFSPWTFVFSTLFALITVMISCHKPGKVAARISPVEAVHYTEKINRKKKFRKANKGASLVKMAWANLWRSPGKTVITILSLSLAVVLLNLTVILANGVDMQKALRKMPENFILENANGLVVGKDWTTEDVLTDKMIQPVMQQKEITSSGKTYVPLNPVLATQTEEYIKADWANFDSAKQLKQRISHMPKLADGNHLVKSSLLGMEDYGLNKCEVIKGDINKLKKPGKYIAAVYARDDYYKLKSDSHWAKLGDKVTVRYADEYEYCNPYTGKKVNANADVSMVKATKYHDVEYEVAALVTCADSLMGNSDWNQFIMNDKTLIQDSGASGSGVEYYAFDAKDKDTMQLEHYLKDYTETKQPQLGYDSQIAERKTWESSRKMFMMLGGVLSLVIGIVGVLNFLNAELTGILARKQEFAVEQSIGMTGKQLKKMLIFEGVFYAVSAVAISLLIGTALSPLFGTAMGKMFWFFTYHFTIWPVLAVAPVFVLLGILLPLISYRFVAKRSIVERLREAEA